MEERWCEKELCTVLDAIVPTYDVIPLVQKWGPGCHGYTYKVDWQALGPTEQRTKQMWLESMQHLLKCRAVCKQWLREVVHMVDDHQRAFEVYLAPSTYRNLMWVAHSDVLQLSSRTLMLKRSRAAWQRAVR